MVYSLRMPEVEFIGDGKGSPRINSSTCKRAWQSLRMAYEQPLLMKSRATRLRQSANRFGNPG